MHGKSPLANDKKKMRKMLKLFNKDTKASTIKNVQISTSKYSLNKKKDRNSQNKTKKKIKHNQIDILELKNNNSLK